MLHSWYDAAAVGFLVLVAAAIFWLLYRFLVKEEGLRVPMAIAMGLVLDGLALDIGGSLLLDAFGLAWRSPVIWSVSLLIGLGGACGLMGGVLRLDELLERHPVAQAVSTSLASLASVALVFFMGWLLLIVTALAASNERVTFWEDGRRAVERDDGFLDPCYNYYEYHGPLVRGSQLLGQRESPMKDFEQADDGALLFDIWTYQPLRGVDGDDCGQLLGFVDSDPEQRVYCYRDAWYTDWLVYQGPQTEGPVLYREVNFPDAPEGPVTGGGGE